MMRLCLCLSLTAALALALALAAPHLPARAGEDDPEPPSKKPREPRPQMSHQIVSGLAAVKRTDTVYAVGDAALAVWLVKSAGCKAVGFDDANRVKAAREAAKKNKVEGVTFEALDWYKLDLKGATVVAVNLDRKHHKEVVALLAKVPAGTRVVSAGALAGVKGGKSVKHQEEEDVQVTRFVTEKRKQRDKEVEVKVPVTVRERRTVERTVTLYKTPLEKSD